MKRYSPLTRNGIEMYLWRSIPLQPLLMIRGNFLCDAEGFPFGQVSLAGVHTLTATQRSDENE